MCSPVLVVKTTGLQLCDPWWVPGPPLRLSFMSAHWPPVLPCRQDGADSKAGLVGPSGLSPLLSCHLSSAGHTRGLSPLLPVCGCSLLNAGRTPAQPAPTLAGPTALWTALRSRVCCCLFRSRQCVPVLLPRPEYVAGEEREGACHCQYRGVVALMGEPRASQVGAQGGETVSLQASPFAPSGCLLSLWTVNQ